MWKLSKQRVDKAVAEFDRLGREDYLHQHGASRARHHFLKVKGRLYDLKPIVGPCIGEPARDFHTQEARRLVRQFLPASYKLVKQ